MKSLFTAEAGPHSTLKSNEWEGAFETLSAFEDEEGPVSAALRKGAENAKEAGAVRLAIARGDRDENSLASMIFYARHPERNRRKLARTEPNFARLSLEWLEIRDRLVRPALRQPGGTVSAPSGPAAKCVEEQNCAPVGCTERTIPELQRMRTLVPYLNKYGSDFPIEFLLGWIYVESNGCIGAVTKWCERGYFQIHPGEACEIGADPQRLSTDREYSVQKGIEMVKRKMIRASALGFVRGTDLFWRVTKLLHWLPGGVNAIVQSMKARGGLPKTWQEFSKFVDANRTEIIGILARSVNQPGLVGAILRAGPPGSHGWDPVKGVASATKAIDQGRLWAERLRQAGGARPPAPAAPTPAPAAKAPVPAANAPVPVSAPASSISLGLDTASVGGNKNPNWVQAKAQAQIGFAIIRSNWSIYPDSVFDRDWPKIKEAGMVRGAYLFLTFPRGRLGSPDPLAQAQAFIKKVGKLEDSDLPPSLDVEFPGDLGRRETNMTARQCLDGVRAAWRVLKDHYGVAPIIYTSARVWKEDLDNLPAPDLVESPLWLARYPFAKGSAVLDARVSKLSPPPVPPPWGDATNWWIHQYQGDAIQLAGFSTGNVDLNRFNTTLKGATGDRVKWVQRRLGIAQNGQFDSAMDGALRVFKDRKGVGSESGVGPRTFACLCWSNP